MAAELNLARSVDAVDLLVKDESERKLRCSVFLLQHQIDDLNELLWEETERGEEARADAESWRSRADGTQGELELISNELRSKSRDHDILKVTRTIRGWD